MRRVAHRHAPHSGTVRIPERLRRLLLLVTVPIVAATLVGMFVLRPRGRGPDLREVLGPAAVLVDGTVTDARQGPCAGTPQGAGTACQELSVRLTSGPDAGQQVTLENALGPGAPEISVGDRIVVGLSEVEGGPRQYYFSDYQRGPPTLLLAAIFALAVVALGRWQGLRALAALVATLLVLVLFVLPAILQGRSPIAVAVISSAFIMLVVLCVTGGWNVRTMIAFLGTSASLALIAVLAWAFVEATQLTGLASEEATFLQAAAGRINLRGLLLGGVIIGSLGVLDDMTVTQVAAVWELRQADPSFGFTSLYRAAERIGRSHIASTVNTLVLAYAGASLPLLILFTQSHQRLGRVFTGEIIATEVVRTLVGSIGLVASVPITTALGAFVLTRGAGPSTPGQEGDRPTPGQRWRELWARRGAGSEPGRH